MRLARKSLLLLIIGSLSFTSCVHRAYYQSPMTAGIHAFHPLPVAEDSVKSATYVNAAVNLGGMNDQLRDNVFMFQGSVHRSHVVNNFRMFYGAALGLGTYYVEPYNYYSNNNITTTAVNERAGTKFFGAYGAYGGISAAVPMGRRSEWRVLGVEGGLFNEFGGYSSFRKDLPDSAANTIDRKKYLGSLGISTEFVFKRRSQNKTGMKFTFGSYLRRLPYFSGSYYYRSKDNLLFLTANYNFTIRKTTSFFQLNFATHTANFQFGFAYKL